MSCVSPLIKTNLQLSHTAAKKKRQPLHPRLCSWACQWPAEWAPRRGSARVAKNPWQLPRRWLLDWPRGCCAGIGGSHGGHVRREPWCQRCSGGRFCGCCGWRETGGEANDDDYNDDMPAPKQHCATKLCESEHLSLSEEAAQKLQERKIEKRKIRTADLISQASKTACCFQQIVFDG